jgi:hypothetical protein
MNKFVFPAVCVAALFLPSTAEAAVRLKSIAYCPAPASHAFKVVGARGEYDGVASEYQWLARTLPGWRRDQQALISDQKGRYFDLLYVSNGSKRQVLCFDVTAFYGRAG